MLSGMMVMKLRAISPLEHGSGGRGMKISGIL